jgi:hypothetical protein
LSFQGSVRTYPLIDLLQWIDHHSVSGHLRLSRGEATRTLDVERGRIVFASSTVPRERLGTWLVERRTIPASSIYSALARQLLTRQPLTRLLAEGGLIGEAELRLASTELAEKIIFDSFDWDDAEFRFDPGPPASPHSDALQIHLSLEASILAFRGAKQIDDTSRTGTPRPARRPEPPPPPSGPDDDSRFWAAIERATLEEGEPSADGVRERFAGFRAFAARARGRANAPATLFPVFGETASMLDSRLSSGEASDELLLQLAALDPNIAANLLLLGNCLTTDRAYGLVTPREVLASAGTATIRELLAGLTAPTAQLRSSDDPLEVLAWRRALAHAVAAAHLAELFGVDREEAYYLGLLADFAWAEMLPLLVEVPLPSRAFRTAVLEQLQPEIGKKLADRLALPTTLTSILACEGEIDVEATPALHMIFLARELAPRGSYGARWRGKEVSTRDIAKIYSVPDGVVEPIRTDISRLYEFLGLPE